MSLESVADVIAAVLMCLGVLLIVISVIGLIRFPDVVSRLHAATKPQLLGLILLLVGVALSHRSWSVLGMLIVAILAQMLSAPASAHMVGRSGFRHGLIHSDYLVVDELTPRIAQAQDVDEDEDGFIDPGHEREDPPDHSDRSERRDKEQQ